MNNAARSLTDWPGFMNSAVPRIVHPVTADTRSSLISGVLPMASIIPLRTAFSQIPGGAPTLDDQPFGNKANQVLPRRRRNIGETKEWYHSTIVTRIHRLFAAAAHAGSGGGFNRRFPISGAPVERNNLDINTLFLVTIYVEAILGLLLLFAWVQNTRSPPSPGGAART